MSPHWNWLSFIALELYHFKCLCGWRVPLPLPPSASLKSALPASDREGLSARKKKQKKNK